SDPNPTTRETRSIRPFCRKLLIRGNNLKSFASPAALYLVNFKLTVNGFFQKSFSVSFETNLISEGFVGSDFSFPSRPCCSSFRRLAARSAAVIGVLEAVAVPVNTPWSEKMTFLSFRGCAHVDISTR
ncbi:MAG: hypothetical protein KIS86_16085, partial [Devosia sp.]|nr:hypothetical protein [Devosia sp.]